ncbi:MAG: hypothetical protein A4E27_01361 [Methanobacterium sp. PtaU1.Bin242]|nr:MAG: hypothetical protein A4E27_01361 [Methanobacterium sp. PtaU1.Bin242]
MVKSRDILIFLGIIIISVVIILVLLYFHVFRIGAVLTPIN